MRGIIIKLRELVKQLWISPEIVVVAGMKYP
jgi:hypothetical protein